MSHDEHADAPALPYCRNCHFTLATPRPVYCGHCGQETDLHPPSVREMFTEYLGHHVAFDGPLWRTLWALVGLPGHLTNAYFHGQPPSTSCSRCTATACGSWRCWPRTWALPSAC